MPIMIWVVAVISAFIFVAAIWWLVWAVKEPRFDSTYSMPKSAHIAGAIICVLVAFGGVVGPLFWLYGTASGQRAQKSFASETSGGLTRVVKVYDLQGDVIGTYEGTFDIQEESSKVFFDRPQEDGTTKRVQIYNATVIVEEK